MRTIVVGAGVAGLGAALALSRQGHEVTIVERDDTPLPADPDAAFAWERRGAPQVRHSHALLARLRNLLRDRYPDVLDALFDAGLTEIRFVDMMPETIADRSPQPGDEDLIALAGRRTTFEWVLRRCVLADPRVTLTDGVVATGLRAAAAPVDGIVRIDGVQSTDATGDAGAAVTLDADLVVVANGRRCPLPTWLEAIGVDLPEVTEDTGIVYYSRFYRLRDGAELPPQNGPIGVDLGYLKVGVFQGDNRTFSITLACQNDDQDLRSGLLHEDQFARIAASIPVSEPWLAPGLAEPITPVNVMAKLLNRRRRFLTDDGQPRVVGLHAVGDAHTCTNPLYGRGCSLAMVQGTLLADALADAGDDDPVATALAYETASAREIDPWYRASVAQDRMNRQVAAEIRGIPFELDAVAAAEPGPLGGDMPVDQMRQLMQHGLFPALKVDPVVFRAFLRMFNLLTPPDALLTDWDVVSRVLQVFQDRDNRPPEDPFGPTRSEMLASLTGST